MSRELTLEYIGPSDEERAHLRLLLRSLADRLAARWRWGGETQADVLFIDVATLAGQMARTRAQQGGVRSVLLGGAERPAANELVLPRPLKSDAFARVLNTISAAWAPVQTPVPALAARLTLELEPVQEDIAPDPGLLLQARQPRGGGPSHDDAERLFRRDVAPEKAPGLASVRLDGASLQVAAPPSSRSDVRRAHVPDAALARPGLRIADPHRQHSFPLRDFLQGELLGGPSRLSLDGLPALALDPKEHAFHAASPLSALLPLCRMQIRLDDWQPLTTTRLRALREQEPARDYLHLLWLDRLQQGAGQLPRHLDPGGTYRLRSPFEVASDFPRQQRIVRSLALPVRLHEIAASAGVSMGDVFEGVAALDAIGLIECRPRERLSAPAAQTAPSAPKGLLARALTSISLNRGTG
jgi:hypothetical protein